MSFVPNIFRKIFISIERFCMEYFDLSSITNLFQVCAHSHQQTFFHFIKRKVEDVRFTASNDDIDVVNFYAMSGAIFQLCSFLSGVFWTILVVIHVFYVFFCVLCIYCIWRIFWGLGLIYIFMCLFMFFIMFDVSGDLISCWEFCHIFTSLTCISKHVAENALVCFTGILNRGLGQFSVEWCIAPRVFFLFVSRFVLGFDSWTFCARRLILRHFNGRRGVKHILNAEIRLM